MVLAFLPRAGSVIVCSAAPWWVSLSPTADPGTEHFECEIATPGGPPVCCGWRRQAQGKWRLTSSSNHEKWPTNLWVCWAVLVWASLAHDCWLPPVSVISWWLIWRLGDPDWPRSAGGSWQAVGRGSGSDQVPWRLANPGFFVW